MYQSQKTDLWKIACHLRLNSIGRCPRFGESLHCTLEVHFANSRRHQHAEKSLNMCTEAFDERSTRALGPAGGALLNPAPPSEPPASRKTDTTRAFPFQRFSFLSRCFNEFLFFIQSPAHGGGWACCGLFTLVIHRLYG